MKQLVQLNLTLITIFMTACSSHTLALETTSHNSDKKSGYLQKELDDWLQTQWNPAVKKKDAETKKRFELQDYVDKVSLYVKAHQSDSNTSHIKKLESMPVIGK